MNKDFGLKKYWFYLESHIYVSIKENQMLLYDTHTNINFFVKSLKVIHLIESIYKDENIGSIELDQTELNDPVVKNFIDKVILAKMGSILGKETHPIKPVILLPILSLNFDMEKLKDKENLYLFMAKDISKYLLDVNLVLNNSCQQDCLQCLSYSKQFFCCSKNKFSEELAEDTLENLLRQISYFPLRTINITGGNIYQYKHLSFFDLPSGENNKIFNFYVNYLNYESNSYIDKHTVHLIINTPINYNKLRNCILLSKGKEVKFHVIIEDTEQYEDINAVLTDFGIKDYKVHPFYNGHH